MFFLSPYITAFAAIVTLTALALDIALLALVKGAIYAFGNPTYTTDTAPGLCLTFVAFVALILGAVALCFGGVRYVMRGACRCRRLFWQRSEGDRRRGKERRKFLAASYSRVYSPRPSIRCHLMHTTRAL